MDLQITLQESIAWIDEAGNCFFLENFDCHHTETGKYQDPMQKEPYGPSEIKLLLEIEINGVERLRASFL